MHHMSIPKNCKLFLDYGKTEDIFSWIYSICTNFMCKAYFALINVTVALSEIDIWTLEMSKVFKVQMSIPDNSTVQFIGSEYAFHNGLVQIEKICVK